MRTDRQKHTYVMPDDNVSPKVKETDEWGLQAAEYIIHHQNSGVKGFANFRIQYEKWRKYYMGKQDTSQYMPIVRMDPNTDDREHLVHIRQDVKNYATNIINIVVSKMMARKYDPVVDPKDPLAIDLKKEYKSKVRSFIEQKQFLESIGVDASASNYGIEIPDELIPQNITELDLHMELDYKMEGAVELEKAIANALDKNQFYDLHTKLLCTDLAVCGAGAINISLDQNQDVRIKYIDAADMIVPYSMTGDWSNVKYMAHKEFMTIDDIKSLNTTLGEAELREIERQANDNNSISVLNADNRRRDELDTPKYEVIHFEYKTTNQLVYLKKKDAGGNVRLHEKDWSYYNSPAKMKKFKEQYGEDRKLIRRNVQAIYTGYFIVGTRYVMNYGLKENIETPEGAFGQSVFGYKVFAPTYYNGHIVSLMGQMEPVLDDLQEYCLKLREHLAQPFPDGVMVDLHALRKASESFKWNSNKMSVQKILEMAYQNKVLLFDSSAGKYSPGSNYKPVHSMGDGSRDVAKYLQLIGQALMELERITGLNQVTLAATLDKKAGKGVTEIQQQASEVALDYLYEAKKFICKETYKSVGTLTLLAAKFGNKKGLLSKSVIKHSYDYVADARPTDYDWAEFYQELVAMQKSGMITPSDLATVKQIPNLKQARAYLRVMEKQRMNEAAEKERSNNEFNIKSQMESLERSHQAKMAEIQAKSQGDIQVKRTELELEQIKHKNEMEKLQLQMELERENKMAIEMQKATYDSEMQDNKMIDERMTKLMLEKREQKSSDN